MTESFQILIPIVVKENNYPNLKCKRNVKYIPHLVIFLFTKSLILTRKVKGGLIASLSFLHKSYEKEYVYKITFSV